MLQLMDIAFKEYPKQSEKPSSNTPSRVQTQESPLNTPSPGPRRRVVRKSSSTPQVDPIPEDNSSEILSIQSLAKPIVRSRRRVSRNPSVAGSEYTIMSNGEDNQSTTRYDMGSPESIHIKTFSSWFNDNYRDDASFSVILASAADSRMADNPLTRDVLEYIRSRKAEDSMYDPYDELSDPDSNSSKWITEYMAK
jgi:hypothetical protein